MKLTNEVKIALTAIAAATLLFIGINFLKGVNIFESSNSYYVKFKDIKGLAVSNAVYANGYPVGIVREIDYNYSNNSAVVVRIELDNEMRIPRNTKAELELALMGGVTMNLILGKNPSDVIEPRDTITGGMHVGTMDMAAEMLPQVQTMLPKIDSILANLNRLSGDPALQQSLHNAALITENLKATTTRLDQMMATDIPQMMANLNKTSANAERLSKDLAQSNLKGTLEEANTVVQNVNKLSNNANALVGELHQKLNSRENNLGALLHDRLLYDRLTNTVQNADSLVTDLKAHPKRYVHFSIFGRKN